MDALLDFIKNNPWGVGIVTKPHVNERMRKTHEACLRLEKEGLLKSEKITDKITHWMPIDKEQ